MKGLPTPMHPGERFMAMVVVADCEMKENTLVRLDGLNASPCNKPEDCRGSIVSSVHRGDCVWMVYHGQAEARTV
jgi:hypothetical protein